MTPQASVSTPFVNIPADEKTMAEMITRITPLVRVVLFANVLRLYWSLAVSIRGLLTRVCQEIRRC